MTMTSLQLIIARPNSMPAVNIREDENNYFLELAVPGMDKKNLKIDINEDVLTISSESQNENGRKQRWIYKKRIQLFIIRKELLYS